MARIVFTFEPEWDSKEQKNRKSRTEEYQGTVRPPHEHLSYFMVERADGGITFIDTCYIAKVETFLEE